ncbi:MAG: flagellar filament capping protein FliD [Rubrivivax sp.]
MSIGTLSSAGLGSGLDVNGIVTQLISLERRPINLLNTSKGKLDTQLSGLGKLQSNLDAVRDASRKLTSSSAWTPTGVSSNNTAVVATSDGSTPAGSYSVNVTQMASPQSLVSRTFPTPSQVLGTGTLTIELGQWFTNPPDFTPDAGASAISIEIAEGEDTLEAIRDKINDAEPGVMASIITDATGSRLSIRSRETGELQGFRIAVDDSDGTPTDSSGLSALSYDARNATNPMTRSTTAANAELTINNIPISSTTNSLSNVVDGLSLKVTRLTTDGPANVAVSRDNEAIKKNITDFAEAYNNLVKVMREQTAYNAETKTAGALQGDRMAVGMLDKLRTLAGSSTGATTAFTRLADIGLSPQRDGTLSIDSSKLDAAVARLDDLKTFFSRDSSDNSEDGFGTLIRQFADSQTNTEGPLTARQEGLRDRIDGLTDRAARMEDRLTLTEKRLREQYTRLDTNMAQLTGLQSYVAQQMTILNRSVGS